MISRAFRQKTKGLGRNRLQLLRRINFRQSVQLIAADGTRTGQGSLGGMATQPPSTRDYKAELGAPPSARTKYEPSAGLLTPERLSEAPHPPRAAKVKSFLSTFMTRYGETEGTHKYMDILAR